MVFLAVVKVAALFGIRVVPVGQAAASADAQRGQSGAGRRNMRTQLP